LIVEKLNSIFKIRVMKNKVVFVLLGAVAGFAIGYLIFGKSLGSYVSLQTLFDFSGGELGNFGRSLVGIKAIQQKVFIFTGIGAVVALIYALARKK
jgi:hypothetical protein